MAFQLSAGVLVVEKDLTTSVPAVATSIGGFVGQFQWGPVLDVQDVSSELDLVRYFGKPNTATFASFFSAANFLGYSNSLKLVRVVDTAARNAVASGTAVAINNRTAWETLYDGGEAAVGPFAAKYPGVLGNSLRVSMADSATFINTLAGLISTNTGSATVTGTSGTLFLTELHVGAKLYAGTTFIGTVLSIASDTSATLTANALATFVTTIGLAHWVFADLFDSAPSTSEYAATFGGSNDELHIVVQDYDGAFTGVPGTILEKFVGASKAVDAKTFDGANNFYLEVLATSEYVWWMDAPEAWLSGPTVWDNLPASSAFPTLIGAPVCKLSGGLDGSTPTDGNVTAGFDLFLDADLVDVNLLITGHWPLAVGKHVIENIAEVRKDCVVVVSPTLATIQNNVGTEAEAIVTARTSVAFNVNSSYAMMDCNWKYQYDKYNDLYRWIPINPDIAGLMARTDNTNDAWWSPGGLTRGQIKNVTKLAWNPNQSQRDTLYKNGINPVISKRGQGTVLWGDKTLLSKPSAFDRINVRRLFIVLEKSIAIAGETQLFEFNDAFTRSYFRNIVEPFLRDVQSRRGVTDFLVVCDERNNTPQVIDRNEFVADIYIKPVRSINFITLSFVATRTGVSFTELQGA